MPTYDKAVLGKKAREFGFNRDTFEKMSRLTDVLQFINSEQELNPLLALKGGTAINLTVFNLPRLSVDIDLDFSENIDRDSMTGRRKRLNDVLGRYMTAQGYLLSKKSKHTHALDSFVYSYTNAGGNIDNIKIEINYMLRCHILPTIEVSTQISDLFSSFPIRTLSPIEIFASKIVALSNRAAARDLFDMNNAVNFGLFCNSDITLLRKCVVFYFAIAGDRKAQNLDFTKMSILTERTIRTDLYPMLRNAERFDITLAKESVMTFLSEITMLTDEEKSFLQKFKKGHYEPALLFYDKDIINRIQKHPMAAWRIRQFKEELDER